MVWEKMKLLLAAAVCLLLLASCSGSGGSGARSENSVKVGVVNTLTGGNSVYGRQAVDGVKIAAESVNGAGGIRGKMLELVIRDDASSKAESANLFRQLAEDPEVVAIIGPTFSSNFLATAPAAKERQIVYISPGSEADWPPGQPNDWTFRVSATVGFSVRALLDVVVPAKRIRTVAHIFEVDNPATVSSKDAADAALADQGIPVVEAVKVRTDQRDFSAEITLLLKAQADAVLVGMRLENAVVFMRQARDRNLKSIFIGAHGGLLDSRVYELAGPASVGLLVPNTFNVDDPRPVVARFREDFHAAGKEPTALNALGYDSLLLVADAIKRGGKQSERRAIRDALGKTSAFEGVGGVYSYSGKGDNLTPGVYVMEMTEGGAFRQVLGATRASQ